MRIEDLIEDEVFGVECQASIDILHRYFLLMANCSASEDEGPEWSD